MILLPSSVVSITQDYLYMVRGLLLCMLIALGVTVDAAERTRPNVIYIMADELGYFEPGFMGGTVIATPNLDRLARSGMIFKNLLSGGAVCAPARCAMLTGKHLGHASVRANDGGTPLRADDVTIADWLKRQGYVCGGFGKWGCGGRDSTGVPERHGFETFFGYYDQVHAHTFYPPYLVRNSEEVPLAGNKGGLNGPKYSHYEIHQAAMTWLREHATQSFFAFLAYTPPHGPFTIPETDPAWKQYADQPWPKDAKLYAAMTTMLDRHVGEVLDLLQELQLEPQTVVFFSGDNGGKAIFPTEDRPAGIFSANQDPHGPTAYRGSKGTLYEGGLRVPFAVTWPGQIPAGRVSEHLGYFPDVLPTIAELVQAPLTFEVDGLSLVPELLGDQVAGHPQATHEYLYWEHNQWTAIRQGSWRAVKPGKQDSWELYDVSSDPAESRDLSQAQPDQLARLIALAQGARQPVQTGSYTSRVRHERDRRAKSGKVD
jgi:arylsulfatase A-like enzyme